ncbi:adenosylcobinamide amidohydrolase [Bilifractor sp. LCP21S3_A7]|uniref:adenosylcobinamide amidohydrolase n=1 Tax=Bilifractor sp. LCP21S3_A7 TaxID=3438738 RepID=UPI003F8E88D8
MENLSGEKNEAEMTFRRTNSSSIFHFNSPRKTLCTSPLNGGIREGITTLMNINCQGDGSYEVVMKEDDYGEELARQVREEGENPETTVAMSTAAWIELSAEAEETYEDLTVRAVVSGGIEHNAVSPGDPTWYMEKNGQYIPAPDGREDCQKRIGGTSVRSMSREEQAEKAGKKEQGEQAEQAGEEDQAEQEEKAGKEGQKEKAEADGKDPGFIGTINIILMVNQRMTDAAMLRALVLCSEAKAAAVQELLLGSCYSHEIATGSGTDGTIIAAPMESEYLLTTASGHVKLGELIGKTVKKAVKEALVKQSSACPARQFQILQRVRRFGLNVGSFWDFYEKNRELFQKAGVCFSGAEDLVTRLQAVNQSSTGVIVTSLYVHLMDQFRWGLVMYPEVIREGKRLLQQNLYCGNGKFLCDVFPEAVLNPEEGKKFNSVTQYMYFLMLYMWVLTGANLH